MTTNPFLTIVLFMYCAILCEVSERARARTLSLDPFKNQFFSFRIHIAFMHWSVSNAYTLCVLTSNGANLHRSLCNQFNVFLLAKCILRKNKTFEMTFLRCSHSYRLLIEMHTWIFWQLCPSVRYLAGTKFHTKNICKCMHITLRWNVYVRRGHSIRNKMQ